MDSVHGGLLGPPPNLPRGRSGRTSGPCRLGGAAGETPEEGRHLRPGDVVVRCEPVATDAGGDASIEEPVNGVGIEGAAVHVRGNRPKGIHRVNPRDATGTWPSDRG